MRLVEAEPEPALEALRSHALDLVLADEWSGTPRPRRPGLDREDLFAEPVRIALAGEPPGAGAGGPVPLAELAGAAWATGDPGGGMAALMRRVCNAHGGFEPDIRHHTNELTMLLALVARGQAMTLLPELALAGGLDGRRGPPDRGRRPDAHGLHRRARGRRPPPRPRRRPRRAARRDAALRPGSPSSRSGRSGT